MNHKLDELFEQAGGSFGNDGEPILPDIEKFAELIVRECIDFLTDDLDYPDAALKLKARFGVENDT